MHRMRRVAAATLIAAVVAAVSTACVASSEPMPTAGTAGFDDVYAQTVSWTPCAPGVDASDEALAAVGRDPGDRECATIEVPLDWADPARSDRIELALARYPATSGEPIGSLLTNPGGPGASGRAKADRVAIVPGAQNVLAAYDLVGFDPRGIGASAPLVCDADADLPGTVNFARCVDDNELAHYMGTSSVARDMDVIRAVLGDAKLNYLGYSYGTVLGATYATLFPGLVGRMILDSAIDASWASPVSDFDQTMALSVANGELGNWCRARADAASCPTWTSLPELEALYDALSEQPWVATDDTEFDEASLANFLDATDYKLADARLARLALVAGAQRGDQDGIDALAADTVDVWVGMAGSVVKCFSTPQVVDWAEFYDYVVGVTGSPEAAESWVTSSGDRCRALPEWGTDITTGFDATGSAPILVFGVTGDHATPYPHAQALVQQLGTATLVTLEASQHGASYANSSACADRIADAYLLHGEVPASGVVCQLDAGR